MSYARFETEIAKINDILCSVNLLSWDARTQMPHGGVDARGQQIGTLTSLARDMAVSDKMRSAMDAASNELAAVAPDDIRHRALAQAAHEIDVLGRIPEAIIGELADLKSRAHAAWADARANNDFVGFAPVLERMMQMQRQIAEAIGYDEHPYDALVSVYEPGMTLSRLQGIYGELKSALVPLIAKATAVPAPRSDFLRRSYPIAQQKAFAMSIAERLGYDLNRGRLDDTAHPFEISFTRDDVRITSNFKENWLPGGVFALWHEAGHGIYEQSIAPEYTRSIFATDLINLYAVGGTSFGMHESQSRLLENRVGRSQQFWDVHFSELQSVFPEQLSDVTTQEFWRAVNQVRPDFIRIEADELTYDLHIILRSEIEALLMAGEVEVNDLPALWAEKVKTYLDIDVPNDAKGLLQDVHWSQGYIGSFPTYTLGNIMSAQLFQTAQKTPAIADGLKAGNYVPLKDWLNTNVHQYGRSSLPQKTLERVTGRGLDTAPYIADLTAKVDALLA